MKTKFTYYGKKLGAIGVLNSPFEIIFDTVDAIKAHELFWIKVYEKHEHIILLKTEVIENGGKS